MRCNWADRFLIVSAAVISLNASSALAQRAPSAPSSGAGGGFGSTTRSTAGTGSFPGTASSPIESSPRNLFLSGKVVFDDGAPTNSNIRIERVCSGTPRLEAHTDVKGRFSLQLDQNLTVDTDAADASAGGRPSDQWSSSGSSSPLAGASRNRADPLFNCELRASYPGYRSDVVDLATRRSLDDPDLGTIVLHRLGNVQGTTISVTTALAPRHARKDYEKGVQLFQKGDLENAEKRLTAATGAYPQYAVAWFALGQVQKMRGRSGDARKAFLSAIAADKKYVSPYEALADLAIKESDWQAAADFSKQATDLNAVEFPGAFWSNAFANYNLNKPAAAEASLRSLLKLDSAHKYPQAESLLAHLLAARGDYSEAALHLRAYLQLVPNGKDATALREDLAKLEQAGAESNK
ncbi:MAG: tetratricopeptide repeat protein [Acidobacteriaceae bacterium]|nr:tetratricopeptide repeat protein [Acidobacteriaceae bacterium]